MTDTAWETLANTLSFDVREILARELLDLLKTADKGQAIIETKQHAVHSIFVGHNVIIPKLNGNGAVTCNN
jgi:hypothetical protein